MGDYARTVSGRKVDLGVAPLQAHFFVFYFAVFSTLTPPVAVSVLAAARLAEASFLRTAADSLKIAATTFIIPFAFVYSPELMSFPNLPAWVFIDIAEVLLVQTVVSVAAYGWMLRNLTGWERLGALAVAILGFFAVTIGQTDDYSYLRWAFAAASAVGFALFLLTQSRAPAASKTDAPLGSRS